MQNENGKIYFGVGVDNSELARDVQKSKALFSGLGDSVVAESKRIDNTFSTIAKSAAAIFTVQQVGLLTRAIVQVRGEFQKYEAVLKNTLGSQDAAKDAMALIADIAAKTPFGVDQLTSSYIKLVNQGFTPTRDMIIQLGDLAASQGKSFDQLTEAIIDAQTGEFERLKEFGIRASKEGDKVTFTFKEQATTVDFAASSIRDYILSLGQMQGVAGGMEAISKTIEGKMSNLQDAITAMFNEIGQANEGVIADSIDAAGFLVEHYEEVAKVLASLVVSYGIYKTAIIATVVAQRAQVAIQSVQSFLAMARSIKSAADAQALLNLAMNANPLLAAVSVIAGITTALILFSESVSVAEQAQNNLNDAINRHNETVVETKVKIEDLVSAIQNENLTNDQRAQKLSELQTLTNGRLGQLTLESFKTGEATKAINLYIDALNREAQAKAFQETKIANIKRMTEIEKQKGQKLGFLESVKYTFLAGVGGSAMQARNDELDKEHLELEKQNLKIDNITRQQLTQDAQRIKQGNVTIVKNKEYWEKQKASAQASYDSLDDINRKSAKGQELAKQILDASQKIDSYNVKAQSKASSSGAGVRPQTQVSQEVERLNQAREQLIKEFSDMDYDFTKEVRLDKFEGVEKQVEAITIRFEELREEFKKLGIDTPKNLKALSNLEAEKKLYAREQAEREAKRAEKDDLKKWGENAIQDYGSYEQKKLEILNHYKNEREKAAKAGRSDIIAGIKEAEQEELNSLKASNSDKIANMQEFADGAIYLTKKAVQQQIEVLNNLLETGNLPAEVVNDVKEKIQKLNNLLNGGENTLVSGQLDKEIKKKETALAELAKTGDTTSETFKRLNDEIMRLKQQRANESLNGLGNTLNVLSQVAPQLEELSSSLAESGDNTAFQISRVFSSIASGANNLLSTLKKIGEEGVTNIDVIASAAQFVVSTITSIISSAQAQRKAYEDFYLQNLSFQHDYNIALVEEIRLREGIKNTVFFSDYAGKINAGLAAEVESVKKYNEALSNLQESQVIIGTKKVRDWGAVAASTLSGATTGAIAGVGAAGIGALVGGVIGGAVGFIGGMLKKRTVVNVYDGLLKTYPKLIDAQGDLDKAMAQSIISSGKIEGSSKANLEYLIAMNEQYEAAKEQIEGVISDLAGSLGSDLMGSLFDDWANGGQNAGQAFKDGVAKSLANIGKNLLFNSVFGDDFVALQERIKESFKTTGDPTSIIAELLQFNNEAAAKGAQYQQLLNEYQKQLNDKGIKDVFGLIDDTEEQKRQASSKGFASMSQDSANELNGRFAVIQTHTFNMNESLKLLSPLTGYANEIKGNIQLMQLRSEQAINHLFNIDTNTAKLQEIEFAVRKMQTGIDDINLKGIKIKT